MQAILQEEGFPLHLFPTYMAMITGAMGSHQYQRLYVATSGGSQDVIKNGDLACAFFVSSILKLCDLTLGGLHTTVAGTIIDLEESGWIRIETPQAGAVVVWEEKFCTDRQRHAHIGFAISAIHAVSNNGMARRPEAHHITFGAEGSTKYRKIVAIFAYPEFMLGNL